MSVMELDYMKRLRWWLKLVDAWPSKVLGEGDRKYRLINSKILLPIWCISLMSQIEYIRRNTGVIPFYDLGHCYVTTLLNFNCCNRLGLVITKSYQMLTKEFVEEMHLFHLRNSSDYAFKIYKKVNKYCRFFVIFLQLQTVIFPPFFNLRSLLDNLSSGMYSSIDNRPVNGTFEYTVHYILPFDTTSSFNNYFFVLFTDFVLTYWATICICMFDLYMTVVVIHLWGHLKILDHELRYFIRPSSKQFPWYTPEESNDVAQRLKGIVNHHRKIMQFAKKYSSTFGPVLALYFAFHQVCCCILLLECSKLNYAQMAGYVPLTVLVFQQLIQTSIIYECLGSKSDGITNSAYCLPWECMQVRERRMFLFFFCNAQKPIHIKALGLVSIGVRTMFGIIKTSMSYFIMLQTLAKE